MPSTHEERQRERHTNKLPTAEARAKFVHKVREAIGEQIKALQAIHKALEPADPDCLLYLAFSPDLNSVMPGVNAHVELTHCKPDGVSKVFVIATTCLGRPMLDEVGIRVVWHEDGTIMPLHDNRFGA